MAMDAWSRQDISRVSLRLTATYPATDLGNPSHPLDDLLYIMLSGQTNESLYQSTFAALKAAYPRWRGLASAPVTDIENIIARGGLSKQKAAYIKAVLQQIEADRGLGDCLAIRAKKVPDLWNSLTSLCSRSASRSASRSPPRDAATPGFRSTTFRAD
jgi:endonuclease III